MVQSIDTLVCKPVHGVRLEGKSRQTSHFTFPSFSFLISQMGGRIYFIGLNQMDGCEIAL